jgi:hypothetical protein
MRDPLPDEISLEWFLKNRRRVRDAMSDVEKPSVIVGPEGQIAPVKTSRGSVNKLADLRIIETSADPMPIAPPVLSLTVDNDDEELDLEWTLPETYNELFLERSDDGGETWEPLQTLPGTQDAYEDGDVTPGTEYSYRIRGRVGGAYSAYSNIVTGELVDAVCSYSLPSPMADSTPFFQGFANGDFSDALWTTRFSEGLSQGSGDPGSANHAGNLFMSEDGKKVIVTGSLGAGISTNILTRENDDSFTVQALNNGGSVIPWRYTMSRTGIVAGVIETNLAALWDSGVTSAPSTTSDLPRWNYISPDGLRLYGVTTSGDDAIERVIGGADTTIQTGDGYAVVAVDHCGTVCVVEGTTLKLYRKSGGTWAHDATLANESGATNTFPQVVQMNGAGTVAIGNAGSDNVTLLVWDITGSGTITATEPGYPGGTLQDCKFTAISSDGSIVVGYVTASFVTKVYYWLASEGFATAHDLEAYFISQGLTNFGSGSGEYLGIDNVVVNANGTAFAVRADRDTGERSIYYVAVPAPT